MTAAKIAESTPAVLTEWQRDILSGYGMDPNAAEWLLTAEPCDHSQAHGDQRLGGEGPRIAVDADCPACGWPERVFDTITRRFGCIRCAYTSDERDA